MAFANKFRTLMIAAALAVPVAILPAAQAHAGVFISVRLAPPPLPVYVQPPMPAEGYMWTPGYWAYNQDGGYYWVPGVWVLPPTVGVLWTPPYWGFEGGAYGFHPGYWGPHVGFYGGVNYGFGYGGVGYGGGMWVGGHFSYNAAVCNFGGVHVTNVYVNRTVINRTVIRASYNGPGGWQARPTPQQMQAEHEQHFQPTANQISHRDFAAQNRSQWASANHGHPAVAAASSVASFHDHPNNPMAAARPTVNQREANQQQRVANGVRSGQMTSGEAARADQRQAGIDRQVQNDRTANGGALNQQQRQQINREQNGASRQISRENHNGSSIAPSEIGNREANQQQRVANGMRSGQMTSGEAARADQRQASIDRQVHNQRSANGGALNQQQRQQDNRRQNNASRQINRENHNGREDQRPPR